MISYTLARETDKKAIGSLLKINNLPYSDLQESPIVFIIATNNERIVGCIGLEKHGNAGLLRSFAVEPGLQNKGIGKELYRNLLDYVRQSQILTLHLLTNTAKDYFSRIGYRLAERNNAPDEIARSAEFAGLCPVSSTYMVADILS
jgi:amino-acid N-acetyltransferase